MTEGTSAAVAVQGSQTAVDEWWGTPEADEVEGYDLLKDDALFELVGVPFMATKAIFRDGIQAKGAEWRSDYVSLELRTAPESVIRRDLPRILSRRKAAGLDGKDFASVGDEQLVINDGSTGIYRQVVQYLAAKGKITLPEGEEEGEKGESIYDLPRSQWLSGAEEATEGIEITLRCSRGLRFSEYENEYTGDGKARTWYIA
jgi:hypothetical protein